MHGLQVAPVKGDVGEPDPPPGPERRPRGAPDSNSASFWRNFAPLDSDFGQSDPSGPRRQRLFDHVQSEMAAFSRIKQRLFDLPLTEASAER